MRAQFEDNAATASNSVNVLPPLAGLPEGPPIAVPQLPVAAPKISVPPPSVASPKSVPVEDIPPGKLAAPDSTSHAYPLDLTTAMRLAGEQNPQIAIAQAQIRHALALEEAADTRWLPSLRAGVGWNRHEGTLQDTTGNVIESNRNSLYSGFGAGAVGAGSPAVPGLQANFNLADALYRPLAARQARQAREHAAAAALNDTLLGVCLGYLELLRSEQESAIAVDTLKNTEELAGLTAKYSASGEGLQSDADRMQVEATLRRNDVERANESVAVASARLNELLGLEPDLQLQPLEPVVAPWKLVVPETTLTCLIDQGLNSRPELAEGRALAAEAQQNLRREELGPRLPHLSLGVSYGGFGGGQGGAVDNFHDRVDLDAVAYWEIRNLGFGDQAARRAARSQVDLATLRQSAVADRVVREISEAYAQVQARRRQIDTARQGITSAQDSYQHNLLRIQHLQGLPIEALQAIQALSASRREYLRAVSDYNTAQFTLLRAVGWHLNHIDLPTAASQ